MKIEVKEETPSCMDDMDQSTSSQIDDKKDIKPLMKFSSPRNKKSEDPSYHYCYKKSSQAEIPEMTTAECDEDDNETPMLSSSQQKISDEHVEQLKQALPHLSIDVVLSIYMACNSDFDCTVRAGNGLVKVDVIPEYVKRIIRANIAVERSGTKSSQPYKVQHFVTMFKNVVDAKDITEFYYTEKNKIGGDWRLENEERVMTEAEKEELDAKLAKCDITVIENKVKLGKRKFRASTVVDPKKPTVDEESRPSCSNGKTSNTNSTPILNGKCKTVSKATRPVTRNSR